MSEEVKKPAFTPGPWATHLVDSTLVVDVDGREICETRRSGNYAEDYETMEANAHLIAAVPDLHEALLRAREEIRFLQAQANTAVGDSTVEFIDDVLRKANGGAS